MHTVYTILVLQHDLLVTTKGSERLSSSDISVRYRRGEGVPGAFWAASIASSSAIVTPENTTVGCWDKSGFAGNVKSLYIEESIAFGT